MARPCKLTKGGIDGICASRRLRLPTRVWAYVRILHSAETFPSDSSNKSNPSDTSDADILEIHPVYANQTQLTPHPASAGLGSASNEDASLENQRVYANQTQLTPRPVSAGLGSASNEDASLENQRVYANQTQLTPRPVSARFPSAVGPCRKTRGRRQKYRLLGSTAEDLWKAISIIWPAPPALLSRTPTGTPPSMLHVASLVLSPTVPNHAP